MRATEIYEGHTIEATTHVVDIGRWGWDYTIDGEHRATGCDRPLRSEGQTLKDAVFEAKARIRHWLRTGEVPLAAEQQAGGAETLDTTFGLHHAPLSNGSTCAGGWPR